MNNQERIICAAIQIADTGEVFFGHRHNHCIEAMTDKLSWTMNRQEIRQLKTIQGFVTTEERFVNRREAMIIAKNNNQLPKDDIRTLDEELYSEDLY